MLGSKSNISEQRVLILGSSLKERKLSVLEGVEISH